MKFRNGYWLLQAGVEEYPAAQVYDYRFRDGVLTLYYTVRKTEYRNETVNAPLLTMEMCAVGPNVLSIRAYHHKGGRGNKPTFERTAVQQEATVEEQENVLVFRAGRMSARIQKKPFHIWYYEGIRLLTESEGKSLAYLTMPDGTHRMKEELSLAVGELIYGLGERFTPFVKNGQSVDLVHEDGGTASEQAYKNIPFYMSSQGYGVWMDTPAPVSLEIASEKVERVQFSVAGEEISYCVIGTGGDANPYQGVLKNYTALTGMPALPPRWSFGLWLSTSFVTEYDQETVMRFLDGMAQNGIPVEVFHFDCCWMKEFEWCNFQWREDCFPDPEGMLRATHDRGIRVCVWINPYIAQKSPLFEEAAAQGYLLCRKDGSVWQTDMWQAGMGIVDFTHPEARKWYQEKLRGLLRMGVDCFKTDFGERIPRGDVVYHDGSDPERMHNYYTLLYNQAAYEVIREEKGEEDAVVFARSATTGGQKYPVHWGGDCESTYRSMAESLRGGLSLMLSGFSFWSHDMGGFEDDHCTPDVYMRWTQFGLLSTHSRYHSSKKYKVPWLYGEEAVEVCREFTLLKQSLMPYIWAQSVESVKKGLPVMRPMLLEFPNDMACRYLDTQYMLGESLLVAPVFSETGIAHFYLPEGGWIHLLTGRVYAGGRWYKEQYNHHSLPVFVRSGSILVRNLQLGSVDYDDRKAARIHIYDVPMEGAHASCYDRKGCEIASVSVRRNEEQMIVVTHGFDEDCRVVLEGQEYPLAGGVLVLV